jgi:hypothetical protein
VSLLDRLGSWDSRRRSCVLSQRYWLRLMVEMAFEVALCQEALSRRVLLVELDQRNLPSSRSEETSRSTAVALIIEPKKLGPEDVYYSHGTLLNLFPEGS